MNASRIARALLLAAPLVASLTSAAPLAAQGAAPHAEAITASRMRADLMFLAGDGFRGRLTDTPENCSAETMANVARVLSRAAVGFSLGKNAPAMTVARLPKM